MYRKVYFSIYFFLYDFMRFLVEYLGIRIYRLFKDKRVFEGWGGICKNRGREMG